MGLVEHRALQWSAKTRWANMTDAERDAYMHRLSRAVLDMGKELGTLRQQHQGAVSAERQRIITRLVEMADVLDQDAVAGTAETLRRAAAVLDVEGGR